VHERRHVLHWMVATTFLAHPARKIFVCAGRRCKNIRGRPGGVLATLDTHKPLLESRDIYFYPLVAGIFIIMRLGRNCWTRVCSGYKIAAVVGQIIPWNFPFVNRWLGKLAPRWPRQTPVVLKNGGVHRDRVAFGERNCARSWLAGGRVVTLSPATARPAKRW